MNEAAAGATPLVQVGALEEQLAAWRILMRWDGPFGRQLAQGVAVNSEVLRGLPGVEPFAVPLVLRRAKPRDDGSGDSLCEVLDDRLEDLRAAGRGDE
jgi:hypothetical protein